MPRVEVTRLIRAPRPRVYQLVKRTEEYPRFMKDVLSVRVLEQGDGWQVTEWVTQLEGRRLSWKEREEFDDQACRIRYRQLEGDLKQFEGEWILEEVPEGTRVTLTVEFDLGIPMLAALLHPIAKVKVRENAEAMLEAIRARAEGEQPGPS